MRIRMNRLDCSGSVSTAFMSLFLMSSRQCSFNFLFDICPNAFLLIVDSDLFPYSFFSSLANSYNASK